MAVHGPHFWKKNPFLKLFPCLTAGIALHWYLQPPLQLWLFSLVIAGLLLISFFFIPLFERYKYSVLAGITILIFLLALGGILTWQKDIRNDPSWLGHAYQPGDALVVTLLEPLTEKERSWKAEAKVEHILSNGRTVPAGGKIIVYFRKDSTKSNIPDLSYGSQLIFKMPVTEIRNSGNPGGFDYQRYTLFRGFTHQVFLKQGEYSQLPGKKKKLLNTIIFASRERVLNILRDNIKGERESGLAEALLIGYKQDLDQSLVQSYTNTGVVHIIAISGLHIGLIYWLLVLLLKPFGKSRKFSWVRPLLIITILWAFALLAGAQPSVLRSTLMFSFIVIGENIGRKTSIYNSIAASAFVLLCVNPFWLWDVGFQMSYSAVLSIVIFMQPISNWFYFKNKLIDLLWRLNAVTLAAQILTIPLSIYHFHQFPTFFFLGNFLAVPVSSIILLGEILLCMISLIPAAALLLGKLISWLIGLMNTYIESIELIPGSLWDGLLVSGIQVVLLFILIALLSYWLFEGWGRAAILASVTALTWIAARSVSFIRCNSQQRIIVYNVPQKRAIDIINGRDYFFVGDSDLRKEGFLSNFHLKPSRILHRIEPVASLEGLIIQQNLLNFENKRLLLLDRSLSFLRVQPKPFIDLVVISGNNRINVKELAAMLEIKQVVFDSSVPAWRSKNWKKEFDSLHIHTYNVQEKGAFVMNLN